MLSGTLRFSAVIALSSFTILFSLVPGMLNNRAQAAPRAQIIHLSDLQEYTTPDPVMRSGPSTGFAELGMIATGTTLPITGRNDFNPTLTCASETTDIFNIWIELNHYGQKVWVWGCHPRLAIQGTFAQIPVVEPYQDRTIPVLYSAQTGSRPYAVGYSRDGFIPFYTAPNLEAEQVNAGGFGMYYITQISGEQQEWIYVSHKGISGWAQTHLFEMPDSDWQSLID